VNRSIVVVAVRRGVARADPVTVRVPLDGGNRTVTVFVDSVAELHGSGISGRIAVVAVPGADEGTVSVGVGFIRRGKTVAVAVLAVADFQGAGVDIRVAVVTVDGSAAPARRGVAVPIGVPDHADRAGGVVGTGGIGAVRLPVAIIVCGVGTDFGGAGISPGVGIVAIVSPADGQEVPVSVPVRTGAACLVHAAVTVVVPAVPADLDVSGKDRGVVVVAIRRSVARADPVPVRVSFDGGENAVTVFVDSVAELHGSGISGRVAVVAVPGANEGAVPVGVGFIRRGKTVAVAVLAVADFQGAGVDIRVAVVAVDGSAASARRRVAVPIGVRGGTPRIRRRNEKEELEQYNQE